MSTPPVTPQLRGYPVDHALVRANRAQSGPRRRRAPFGGLAARLRAGRLADAPCAQR